MENLRNQVTTNHEVPFFANSELRRQSSDGDGRKRKLSSQINPVPQLIIVKETSETTDNEQNEKEGSTEREELNDNDHTTDQLLAKDSLGIDDEIEEVSETGGLRTTTRG